MYIENKKYKLFSIVPPRLLVMLGTLLKQKLEPEGIQQAANNYNWYDGIHGNTTTLLINCKNLTHRTF